MQSTYYYCNNSNQLSNYQLQYYLFTNVHYKHFTDLIKTCKTHVFSALRQQDIFFDFLYFMKKK
jgi:hypothetical protein